MFKRLKILIHHGKQYIPDIRNVKLKPPYRGRPVISKTKGNETDLVKMCPLKAISANPLSLDMGKCSFCGECALAYPKKIKFTQDYRLASNKRENLIIRAGEDEPIRIQPDLARTEIQKIMGRSLKLRQISAGGDNSAELELGAASNPNFDMGRYGIEFVASPRHADGIVITGPISENIAEAVRICYEAISDPKIVILCGVDALSGGLFHESSAIDRGFLKNIKVDLYVPGNPPHPLTFVNGVMDLLGIFSYSKFSPYLL